MAKRTASTLADHFSLRNVGFGMAAAFVILAAFGGYAALRGDDVIAQYRAQMPMQTVTVVWPEKTPAIPDTDDSAAIRPDNYIAIDIPSDAAANDAVVNDISASDTDATPPVTTPDTATSDITETLTDPVTTEPLTTADTTADAPINDQTQPVSTDTSTPFPADDETDYALPLAGLFETSQWGLLPVIDPHNKNNTPFNAYRRPFDRTAAAGKPIISLAVFGLGLSSSATSAAIRDLPPEVSLILSPYTAQNKFWINEARAAGHEVWLTLPMQGRDYPLTDMGPHTLLIGAAERDNLEKLSWLLASATNYTGFVTPADAAFIKAEQDMRPVLSRIYGRGLGFIDSSLMPSSPPHNLARSLDGAYGTADIWLDDNADPAYITETLQQLENLARKQGTAAGIIRPYPISYKVLQDWIATLPEKGIVLAPLSAQTGH